MLYITVCQPLREHAKSIRSRCFQSTTMELQVNLDPRPSRLRRKSSYQAVRMFGRFDAYAAALTARSDSSISSRTEMRRPPTLLPSREGEQNSSTSPV